MSGVVLSGSERVQRGFNRLGLAIAVPVAAIGVAASIAYGFSQYSEAENRYTQANCVLKTLGVANSRVPPDQRSKYEIDISDLKCSGPLYRPTFSEIDRLASKKPDLMQEFVPLGALGVALTTALFGLIYAFFAALGWVFSGFSKD